MRLGVTGGGPCYKTIFYGQPRSNGFHEEIWDGFDANGIVEVWKLEGFQIYIDGFSLPDESITVLGSTSKASSLNRFKKRFPLHPPHGKNLAFNILHAGDDDTELPISVKTTVPVLSEKNIPVIRRQADFTVDIGQQADRGRPMGERIEVYYYMDGKLIYEGPVDGLPAVINVDTTDYSNGEHIFTVNLRTEKSRIGAYSMKVRIEN